jgi:hypothetical protein
VEARCKVHVQPRVIAEVSETQMSQMHAQKMNREPGLREVFPNSVLSEASFGAPPHLRK